ncbi:MAG: hypothetical protein J5708_01505 [Bacteroidales bacterium]|nr:hypothetical protein [Bacteroidales bacterium]
MSKKSSLFVWSNIFAFCGIALLVVSCSVCRQHKEGCVSPLDYGLKKARTGEERYEVLYKVHSEALRLGKAVDYSGIKKIDLVIPKGAKSIPLGERTDFKGVTITVINNSKTLFLFEYTAAMLPISVKASEVDNQIYSEQSLKRGLYLLSIKDEKPWVENREGYSYGATRKDIILVENGKGLDSPCSPYNNVYSNPTFLYRSVTGKEKCFENVVFQRLPGSTYITKLVKISNENCTKVENVSVITPAGALNGDQAICINNCTNVLLKNINIEGTYSTKDKFGYGISMDNVWDVTCENIIARTEWGVFGTNNTHKVHLKGCNVNRFDIHCYGKDVLCEDCSFSGTGGVYSSVFGTIDYRRCTFDDACPYINRPDYNAYVPFRLVLKECIINATARQPFIVNLRKWNEDINARAELKVKCWPDIVIENLTVNISEGMNVFELFRVPREYSYKRPVANISSIAIKGLGFKYSPNASLVVFKLSSSEITLANPLECTLKDIHLVPESDIPIVKSTGKQRPENRLIVNMKGPSGVPIKVPKILN